MNKCIFFLISMLLILAPSSSRSNARDYYITDFQVDVIVGDDVIDFSSVPYTTTLVWVPSFNLGGYSRCLRSSIYTIDTMPAMSLTCTRVEADHVSRTITAMCLPQTIDQAQDQMDLVGDDSANHVLFTIKCRTKLIQQAHKS